MIYSFRDRFSYRLKTNNLPLVEGKNIKAVKYYWIWLDCVAALSLWFIILKVKAETYLHEMVKSAVFTVHYTITLCPNWMRREWASVTKSVWLLYFVLECPNWPRATQHCTAQCGALFRAELLTDALLPVARFESTLGWGAADSFSWNEQLSPWYLLISRQKLK